MDSMLDGLLLLLPCFLVLLLYLLEPFLLLKIAFFFID